MSEPLKVAVAGAGHFADFHLDAWHRLPDVTIVGVCDLDWKRAEAMAKRHGAKSIFNDLKTMLSATQPDLLDVVTPADTHQECVGMAISRSIAAVCQKPFAGDLETARLLADEAEAADVPLFVHENFRYQPWYIKARELLDEKALGTPMQISFRLRPGDGQGKDAYLDGQPGFRAMRRFLIHESGIHFIDVFRYLFGEISGVTARLARFNRDIAGEDAGFVIFDFKAGRRGLFDGNRLADHPAKERRRTMGEMWIEGTEATLRLDGDGSLQLRRNGSNVETPVVFEGSEAKHGEGPGGDSVIRFQQALLSHLQDGDPMPNSARDYLRNLEIEDAIYRSHTSGARVEV